MFRTFSFAAIFVLMISAFAHAGSIDIKDFNFTDVSQASMEKMLSNLDKIYGANIELKFHKKIRYTITSSAGGQAYVDPYHDKEIRLVMQVPWDAQEPEVLATLCHELGHLVSKGRRTNWMRMRKTVATEGQADYFVPSCMKLYMDTFKYIPDVTIDEDTFHVCLNNFHQEFTNTECTIILQSFKNIFAEYNDEISYDKSYGKKVITTQKGHPDDQCRLDTVKDSVLGKGRNRCWFSPIFPVIPFFSDIDI